MSRSPRASRSCCRCRAWDPLKDPLGVVQGFIGHVPDRLGAYLVLAGPAVTSVSDDPESEQVLQQVRRAAAALPTGARARLHLACLPWTTWRRTGHGQRPCRVGPT